MPEQMTVVQLLPALDSGGVERGTLEVARGLVAAGHRSIVISAGGRLVEQLLAEGSEHISWNIGRKHLWTLHYIWRLRRFLRKEQVDILHVRSRLPAWIGYLAWKRMPADRRPGLVSTVHGFYSVKRYSSIMTRGQRVIAVSETVRDYILENYPQVDPGVIRLIPRGVDSAEFPYAFQPEEVWLRGWYAQFPQMRDRKLLTLPGRLTRLKGHHDFLTLIAALRAKKLNVHGVIVGAEDPNRQAYAQEIRARVRELNLQGDVTFTGVRSDMREVFAISDLVFSLSSQPESFGRTALEALSIGTPVIGYDQGGVGEVLEHLYPAGRIVLNDLEGLLVRTVEFLADAPIVPVKHAYTLQSMVQATLAVYQEPGLSQTKHDIGVES